MLAKQERATQNTSRPMANSIPNPVALRGRPHRAARALAVLALALAAASAAQAGRRCDAARPGAATITRAMALAQRTATALEAGYQQGGPRVVLLARAGQDLSRYRQHWSHAGWAYRTPQGQWRVLHKLNDCGTPSSHLVRQGLGEFFLDDLWRYETAWMAPPANLQAALWSLLQDNRRAVAMDEPRYSMLAYAWGTRYQQSNQWALETLALAAEPQLARREQAQAWLKLRDYRPADLRIGALTRLGARLAAGNVAFDDHPDALRYADRIQTVTADSLFDWLARMTPGATPQRLAGAPS